MKKEIDNGIIVLTADTGMYLCNRNTQIIGTVVRLAPSDSPENWEEISETERNALEQEWLAEEQPDSYTQLQKENSEMKEALNILGVKTE